MRGGYLLSGGIGAVVLSYIVGMSLQRAAMESLQRGGPQEMMRNFQGLSATAGLVNLLFLGGVIAVIAGIVLMIVQSSQGQQRRTSSASVEEENRRLREELARIKNQA